MKYYLIIIMFCLAATAAHAQRGDAPEKICSQPCVVFVKKDYKRFKTTSCDLKKYPDAAKTKEFVCEAAYYTFLRDYCSSLELLKHAYANASSEKLKFRIVQMAAENYTLAGDTMHAILYREKISHALSKNPDIDK